MSPNNPGNFVNDLVEMAKAFEALPKVQADLEREMERSDELVRRLSIRDQDLEQAKSYAASLEQKVRDAEVAKDSAETMFLEADDRTARALDFIKATFGNAGSLIQALEPAKAQPEPVTMPVNEPEPIPAWATTEVDHTGDYIPKAEPEGQPTTQPQGQSEVPPEPAATLEPQSTSAPMPNALSQADVGTAPSPAPEVASAHPTQGSDAPISQDEASPSVPTTATPEATATGLTDASFPMPSASPGRYSGKTYSAAKRDEGLAWEWPSEDEWLTNGGTLDNYFA